MRVVAIDGVLGAGKTTIARRVAASLDLEYLDTGAMYRCVGLAVLRAGVAPSDAECVVKIANDSVIDVRSSADGRQVVELNGVEVSGDIRTPEVSRAASIVATHPGVRADMVSRQRSWARARGGGVLEGRDIATVVFPDAVAKVFLTASVEERARRRHAETPGRSLEEIRTELEWRDNNDSTRAVDPLQVAAGATVIDTTGMRMDDVVAAVVALVDPVDPVDPAGPVGPPVSA